MTRPTPTAIWRQRTKRRTRHELYQQLMAVIAEYNRTEIYLEYALLTAFGNPLLG